MSKAFSADVVSITLKNASTTTVPAYCAVRINTTPGECDLITTKGTVPAYGVSQEAINPSDEGKVAVSGISRLKMSSGAYTTLAVTTPNPVTVASNGRGQGPITTSTYFTLGRTLSTWAASDIIAVQLDLPSRRIGGEML